MKASEARQLAISESVVKEARGVLLEHISKAAAKGQVTCLVAGIRLEVAERALGGLGYTLEPGFLGILIVKWGEA